MKKKQIMVNIGKGAAYLISLHKRANIVLFTCVVTLGAYVYEFHIVFDDAYSHVVCYNKYTALYISLEPFLYINTKHFAYQSVKK